MRGTVATVSYVWLTCAVCGSRNHRYDDWPDHPAIVALASGLAWQGNPGDLCDNCLTTVWGQLPSDRTPWEAAP